MVESGLEMNTVRLPPSPPEENPEDAEDPAGNDGDERDSNSEAESYRNGFDAAPMMSTSSFPATNHHDSPSRYSTALPARVAGRPRMVSIQKSNPKPKKSSNQATAPVVKAKPKRQSSIRRLAAKLGGRGGKAARREAAVYNKSTPSESVLSEEREQEEHQEDHHAAETQSTITVSTSTSSRTRTRRSRRLLEQQKEQEQEQSQQRPSQERNSIKAGGTSKKDHDSPPPPPPPPAKTSAKLRKRGSGTNPNPKPDNNNNASASASSSSSSSKAGRPATATAATAPDDAKLQMVKTAAGVTPSLSVRMADWEIAPGRIRVGDGEAAESELYLPFLTLTNLKTKLEVTEMREREV
jgi:hypothetical protein